MSPARFALPLLLAALLSHALTLGAGFVFDDAYAIVNNPTVTDSFSLDRLCHRDFWGRLPGTPDAPGTWRPLPTLSFWVDWHLGHGRAWLLHGVNLLWHALAVLAFGFALRRATGQARPSLLAAGLFAVFACNTEAVASLVGRSDVMAAAFGFGAWWLWRRNAAAACLAYFAACLCKESALLLPLWLAAVESLLGAPPTRQRAAAWAGLGLTAGAYFGLRVLLGVFLSTVARGVVNNPLLEASLAVRLWSSLRLLLLSARIVLFPVGLTADYTGNFLPADRGLAWPPLLGLLALALTLSVALRKRREVPLFSAGVALFLLTWFAVSNVPFALPTIFAERYLYLPSAGVALLLAGAAEHLWAQRRSAVLALALALAVGNVVLCATQDLRWRDELSLFTAAIAVNPTSSRAWLNLAAQLGRRGDSAGAIRAYQRSLLLNPSAMAWSGLGAALDEAGRPEEAEQCLRSAVRLDPNDSQSLRNTVIFLARRRRFASALELLRPYRASHPEDAEIGRLEARLQRSLAASSRAP